MDGLDPLYVWTDGIYVKTGLDQDKAAMLVLIAALRDGRKAEQRFRRLDAPELLPQVAVGVVYVDGVRKKRGNEKAAS